MMLSRMIIVTEGADDSNALYHLLRQHTFPIAERGRHFPGKLVIEHSSSEDPNSGGVEYLLANLSKRIDGLRGDEPPARLGLVIDADQHPDRRWQTIATRLREIGYRSIPDAPDPQGTVVRENGTNLPIIGIWLMPNNQTSGALEEFAHALVVPNDRLWQRAEDVVQAIPAEDRKFRQHEMKAIIHTWLAWQEEPGRPIGQAISKGYLDGKSVAVQTFIDWVRRLFM